MEDGPPGEVAELDFGRLGLVTDPESGRRRTVWALIVVWRYSRHCFVWPTTSQRLDAVVEGLEAAWACFGGVPRYLVIDNFPAAVAGADALQPALHAGLPRVRPPARLHQRPRARAPAPRQAPGRAQRLLRARALLQGRRLPRPRRDARSRPALVPRGGGAAHPRDDPQAAARGLPGGGAPGCSPRGTGNRTSCPTGARRRSTQTTTSPASTRSIRCRRSSARRGRRWRCNSARSWCASTTAARCSRSIRASSAAAAPPTPTTTRRSSAPTRCGRPTNSSGAPPSWVRRWALSPSGSSRGRCPGRSCGRATSCCAWPSATPPPASTPPACGRSRSS